MSLPSASSLGTSIQAQRWSSKSPGAPAEGAAQAFSAALDGQPVAVQSQTVRGTRDLPGYGRIETLKVTETTHGPDGKPVHTVKELAVCPECGTANCACLSRITVQTRLDEENASGVRGAEKPAAFSVVPQTFNQMSASFGAMNMKANSPPQMFG